MLSLTSPGEGPQEVRRQRHRFRADMYYIYDHSGSKLQPITKCVCGLVVKLGIASSSLFFPEACLSCLAPGSIPGERIFAAGGMDTALPARLFAPAGCSKWCMPLALCLLELSLTHKPSVTLCATLKLLVSRCKSIRLLPLAYQRQTGQSPDSAADTLQLPGQSTSCPIRYSSIGIQADRARKRPKMGSYQQVQRLRMNVGPACNGQKRPSK